MIPPHSADAISKMAEGLRVEWILETHVHANHLSAASYLKKKLGGVLGIGSNVRQVQQILGNLFNDEPAIPPGAGFDHLFEDGETFRIGALVMKARSIHPGIRRPTWATCWKMPCSPATPSTARCDFPGGDARTLYRMRAGELPPPESNGRRYFKIPIEASIL